jgi:hypothetical protein
MRSLTLVIDYLLRKRSGLFTFYEEESCLLRIQLTKAPHPVVFAHTTIATGAPVLELHLWNEHVPPIPPEGPNLAWAAHFQRLFVASLRLLARRMRSDSRLAGVRAVGGVTGVLAYGGHESGERTIERLGFTVVAYRNPLGRFGEYWENLYAWWLMDAYNPGSLKSRRLLHLRRSEFWMPVDEFLDRYDRRGAG